MKSLSSFIAVVAFMSPAVVVASDHCAADLNGDGVVGPTDLAMLLVSWGQCPVSCEDGAQNQDETDIDCGGSICPPQPRKLSAMKAAGGCPAAVNASQIAATLLA